MKITILPGDGIGPEVCMQAVKVLGEVASAFNLVIGAEEALIGGAAIDATGDPFPKETEDVCRSGNAVLLGAVGDTKFDDRAPSERPEMGLLKLRKALGGYANLRPASAVPSLIGASPLKPEVFAGTDLLIVRELLGGIYFGEPRGFRNDGREAFNTLSYTVDEVERVSRIAFDAARIRRKKLTSVDKANVLETSRLWRETVNKVAADYPDVEVEHLFVDACAMHLVTDPSRFDVILTDNMFGDILSDEASVLTGSLGMLASATIGGSIDLYEPVHGSAPDIAGKNVANPLGAIASAAMLLRYSAKHEIAAAAIESAINSVLDEGYRTIDISRDRGDKIVSTSEMGDLVARRSVESANIQFAFHAV